MTEVQRLIEALDDKYAEYLNKNADDLSYFILSMETRQAIKIIRAHPNRPTIGEIKEFLGIPVIPLEKVVIVD